MNIIDELESDGNVKIFTNLVKKKKDKKKDINKKDSIAKERMKERVGLPWCHPDNEAIWTIISGDIDFED